MNTYTFREYGKDRINIYPINGSLNMQAPIKANHYHLIVLSEGEMIVDKHTAEKGVSVSRIH